MVHIASAWHKETSELIVEYRKAAFNWDTTLEDVMQMKLYEHTREWFDALAFFKIRNHYRSLDEVIDPKPGMRVQIRTNDGRDEYEFDGEWEYKDTIKDSLYR